MGNIALFIDGNNRKALFDDQNKPLNFVDIRLRRLPTTYLPNDTTKVGPVLVDITWIGGSMKTYSFGNTRDLDIKAKDKNPQSLCRELIEINL